MSTGHVPGSNISACIATSSSSIPSTSTPLILIFVLSMIAIIILNVIDIYFDDICQLIVFLYSAIQDGLVRWYNAAVQRLRDVPLIAQDPSDETFLITASTTPAIGAPLASPAPPSLPAIPPAAPYAGLLLTDTKITQEVSRVCLYALKSILPAEEYACVEANVTDVNVSFILKAHES